MNVTILWVCAGMVGAVFGVMLYSVATFKDAVGGGVRGGTRSLTRELLWALVPIFIFIVAALPIVRSVAASG